MKKEIEIAGKLLNGREKREKARGSLIILMKIFIDFRNATHTELRSNAFVSKFLENGMRRSVCYIEASFSLQLRFHFHFIDCCHAASPFVSKWLQRIFTWIVFCLIFFLFNWIQGQKIGAKEGKTSGWKMNERKRMT